MTKTIGRPMKYRQFIEILEEDQVYTPAAIVRHGEAHGLLNGVQKGTARQKARLRVRHSMARFSANHFFPKEGDGMVLQRGQPPQRGWYGRRWKEELY